MNQPRLFLFAMAQVAVASLVVAQSDTRTGDEKTIRPHSARSADYVYLDDVIGAKVAIAAGAEARREAAEDSKPAKPEHGEIEDVVLDQQSGAMECAIVSFGGFLGMGEKTVALPISLLTWNTEGKRFDAAVDIDQLKALPACDVKDGRKNGFDREILNYRAAWAKANVRIDPTRAAAEASGVRKELDKAATKVAEGVESAKPSGLPASAIRCVAATDIDDHPVYAANGTDKFGKVSKVIVDRNAHRLAYYVVSHGGALGVGDTEYLVAREDMPLCQKANDVFFCLNRSIDEMKSNGVRYEKPKHGVLDQTVVERTGQKGDGR